MAQNVQKSVDHEVGEVVFEGDSLLRRLGFYRLAGKGDVTEEARYRAERLDLREAQDVGGLVDFAPIAVELALFGIAGEDDGDFGGASDFGPRLTQRFEDRGFGDGLEIAGPAFGVAKDGDLERDFAGRVQRGFSAPALFAPCAS